MNKKSSTSENQAKAPVVAAFVRSMREAFGVENVEVKYVKEGSLELGKPDQD